MKNQLMIQGMYDTGQYLINLQHLVAKEVRIHKRFKTVEVEVL